MSYYFLFHVIPLLLSTIYPLDLSLYLAAHGPKQISPIYVPFSAMGVHFLCKCHQNGLIWLFSSFLFELFLISLYSMVWATEGHDLCFRRPRNVPGVHTGSFFALHTVPLLEKASGSWSVPAA